MIIRSRGYLPHIESEEGIYFATFRLAGSLPATLLEAWHSEREDIIRTARNQKRELSEHEKRRLNYLHIERIENYLDAGKGDCWLANPQVAKIVADALQHFDGKRYVLHSW